MSRTVFIVAVGLGLASICAQAETKICENVKIRTFRVEGQQDVPSSFGNKLVITLDDLKGQPTLCGNAEFLYVENTDSSYMGILSTALAANLVGKAVRVGVTVSKEVPKKGGILSARLVLIGL